jgi:protein SCO1/2
MTLRRPLWALILVVMLVLTAALGLSGCSATGYTYSGLVADPPAPIAEVVLTGSDGQAFRLRDLSGKWVLLFFGYSHCPDICPLTLAHMAQVLRELGQDADQVAVVFVSVDPERDTPELLRKFAGSFGEQVLGVTGTRAEIDAAVAAFGARYEIDKSADGQSAAGYKVSHSGDTFLIDPQGRLRLTIPFGIGPAAVLADLRRLMQESG